jgi:hypothetical protein
MLNALVIILKEKMMLLHTWKAGILEDLLLPSRINTLEDPNNHFSVLLNNSFDSSSIKTVVRFISDSS